MLQQLKFLLSIVNQSNTIFNKNKNAIKPRTIPTTAPASSVAVNDEEDVALGLFVGAYEGG